MGIPLQEETPKACSGFGVVRDTRKHDREVCHTAAVQEVSVPVRVAPQPSQSCRDLMEDCLTCSYSHICLFEGQLRPSRLMAA